MKMNNVKLVPLSEDRFEHQDMWCHLVGAVAIQPLSLRPDRNKRGLSKGVSTGEQGHVVAKLYQFLCQIKDDAFGATIQLGWNAFVERRHLRDSHADDPQCLVGGLGRT